MSDVKPPPFNYEPFSGYFQDYISRLQADRVEREATVSEEDRAKILKLREVTSAGILACKKALILSDGDFDKAVEILRTDGLAVVRGWGYSMTDPTAIVDYSRPVGWWCPVCGHDESETDVDVLWNSPDFVVGTDSVTGRREPIHICKVKGTGWCIPVYLPIPEGQRPPPASEVEEAEVCTGSLRDDSPCCLVTVDAVFAPDNGWLATVVHLAEYADADHINDIADESAHIVTGATE